MAPNSSDIKNPDWTLSMIEPVFPQAAPHARRIESNYFCLFLLLSDRYLITHEVLACSWVSRHWDLLCGWWVGRPPINLLLTASGSGSLTKSGRVLGWEGLVLREPSLCEDGVVGGEDGREEGGQDKEEVQQRRSSVRGINLKMKIIKTEIGLGLNTFSFTTKKHICPIYWLPSWETSW